MTSQFVTCLVLTTLLIRCYGMRNVFYKKQTSMVVNESLPLSQIVTRSLVECLKECTNDGNCVGATFCKPGGWCEILKVGNTSIQVSSNQCQVYMTPQDAFCDGSNNIEVGEPRLLIREGTDMTLFDGNGVVIWKQTMLDTIRAMAYYTSKCRIYLGSNPVSSVRVGGSDQKTHGQNYTGTILGMSIDEASDVIYLSVSNYHMEKMDADGQWTRIADTPDVYKPRQNQLSQVENKLYWADEELKTVKSVVADGTLPVTTIFTSNEVVWGMDMDFQDGKIYWCAKSTGHVSVYDMPSMTNMRLVTNGASLTGSCSGLRLHDGFLYLIYYRLDYVEKRFTNGTLASKILQGKITSGKTKYLAIIE